MKEKLFLLPLLLLGCLTGCANNVDSEGYGDVREYFKVVKKVDLYKYFNNDSYYESYEINNADNKFVENEEEYIEYYKGEIKKLIKNKNDEIKALEDALKVNNVER